MRLVVFILLALSLRLLATTTNTYTVKPSGQGGDYTTITSWESGTQAAHTSGDIVADDVCEFANVSGDWSSDSETATVTISGWTTDATRFIEVYTSGGARHTGKWTESAYKLILDTANGFVVNEEYVRCYGMQVQVTSAGLGQCYRASSIAATGNKIIFGYCIGKGVLSGGASTGSGFYINDADAVVTIYDSVIYDYVDSTAIVYGVWSVNCISLNVVNCTVHNSWINYRRGAGTMTVTNCISQDAVSDGFNGTITGDYNLSNGAAGDAPGANSVNETTLTFVNEAADDFHLAASDTAAIGAGFDQPSGLFADDIDGDARSDWDIGADEYIPAGAPASTIRKMLRLRR